MNTENMLPPQPPVSAPVWEHGLGDLTVQVGDLWVTSWDGEDLALVVIAGVHEAHVTVWLVTAEGQHTPAFPSFRLDADWLNEPLVCWPEAQAGISEALLSRRLGNVLTTRDVRAILVDVWESDGETHATVAYLPQTRSEAADDSLDLACRFVAMLSDLDTPYTDHQPLGVLSPRFKTEHSLTSPRDLSAHLPGVPAHVTSAFNAERLLESEEIETLAAVYHVAPAEVVTHPEDATVLAIRKPKWKRNVNDVIETRRLYESEARLRTWERAKVPARQASVTAQEALDARIAHAFSELLTD